MGRGKVVGVALLLRLAKGQLSVQLKALKGRMILRLDLFIVVT